MEARRRISEAMGKTIMTRRNEDNGSGGEGRRGKDAEEAGKSKERNPDRIRPQVKVWMYEHVVRTKPQR